MMIEHRDYYVYVYFRLHGEPCYVGKGRGRRWVQHEKWATNRHLRNVIAQAGGELPKVKIREELAEAEACEIERALIKAIGRRDLGTGPLVNMTDGGEGMSGYKHSPEARAKLKVAWVNRPDRQQALANLDFTGCKHSDATIEKLRNRQISDSTRAKMSAAQRARCARVGERERRRLAKLGSVVSEETRAKIRVAMCGRIVSNETRAKVSTAKKGWKPPPLSAEHKAKLTFAGRRHTAESRAKMSAAALARATARAGQRSPL